MWILDAAYRRGVQLWVRGEKTELVRESYRPSFYLHLPDPHSHADMIDDLRSRFDAEECEFRTVHGRLNGYEVMAGRQVAMQIERQTRFSADLYNVDVRTEQRFMAERNLFPCGHPYESRFTADFDVPLRTLWIGVNGNPSVDERISSLELRDGFAERIEGGEGEVLEQLLDRIGSADPDVLLFPNADYWLGRILRRVGELGLRQTLSRHGTFRRLAPRSYWSYGKAEHKAEAIIPDGRILIDTESSFNYRKGGLRGVLLASRLTGLSPNLTSRFTPGTLVSSYENYEAIRRGIAVPFRKDRPERVRGLSELRASDRGGMMFQPVAGLYEKAFQIDFTSLYPSIIVRHNLSPETLDTIGRKGFLPEVLEQLLELRLRTKDRRGEGDLSGLDAILKWMLVTSFGYTGYRNAKFGSIEVHERITSIAREILLTTKEIAEDRGFEVLHGLVDCLWLIGEGASDLKEQIDGEIGIRTEIEAYDWLVFLPMSDGGGAYNRYYGRLSEGEVKIRGVMAKKMDTPAYVSRMQKELFDLLGEAKDSAELTALEGRARDIYQRYGEELRRADPRELVINRRIGRTNYGRRCLEASAAKAFGSLGIDVAPGMILGCVVRDAKRWIVDVDFSAGEFDARYYGALLDKAWAEIEFVFEKAREKNSLSLKRLSMVG